MKIAIRTLLIIAICVMAYLCVNSIVTPIKFENTREAREKTVIAHLIDIRKIQIEYQKLNGVYSPSADTLINFVINGQAPVVFKEGTLSDEQLKAGLTEEKAMAIIKKGNAKEIEKNGLTGFRRDTTYVSVLATLFGEDYNEEAVRDIFVIPFSNNEQFSIDTASIISASGFPLPLFQASAKYESYLGDLDKQQLINLIDKETKLEHFTGLRVGSITEANNNSGNWE